MADVLAPGNEPGLLALEVGLEDSLPGELEVWVEGAGAEQVGPELLRGGGGPLPELGDVVLDALLEDALIDAFLEPGLEVGLDVAGDGALGFVERERGLVALADMRLGGVGSGAQRGFIAVGLYPVGDGLAAQLVGDGLGDGFLELADLEGGLGVGAHPPANGGGEVIPRRQVLVGVPQGVFGGGEFAHGLSHDVLAAAPFAGEIKSATKSGSERFARRDRLGADDLGELG